MDGGARGERGLGLVAPLHGGRTRPAAATGERALQRLERAALGPRHAAEHARERRALRHARAAWRHRPPASAGGSSRAPRPPPGARAPRAEGPPIRSGAGRRAAIPFPTYAINAVMLPTGPRAVLGPVAARPRDADARQRHAGLRLGPRQGRPPASPRCGRRGSTSTGGDWRRRPCSAPGSRCCRAARCSPRAGRSRTRSTRAARQVSDFKGLNRAFTFDPWALRWTEQPAMRKGRWYPTQAMLADGRIAILAGLDESGTPTDNPDLEVFTPSAVRGGRGAMTRYANAARPGTSYYPHLFTMPTGGCSWAAASPRARSAARRSSPPAATSTRRGRPRTRSCSSRFPAARAATSSSRPRRPRTGRRSVSPCHRHGGAVRRRPGRLPAPAQHGSPGGARHLPWRRGEPGMSSVRRGVTAHTAAGRPQHADAAGLDCDREAVISAPTGLA